jgi:hypothetical protein
VSGILGSARVAAGGRAGLCVDNFSPIWDYLAHHAERIARALDVVVAVPLRGGFRRRARTDST